MLSLKTHNILDYVAGILLLFIPSLFDFETIAAARNFFLVAGFVFIGYSLFTNYYYSIAKIIPLGVHMALDAALGVLLAIAPWILGYRDFLTTGQEVLHYVLGVGLIGVVLLTRSKTEAEKRAHEPVYPGRFSPTGRT